MTRSPWASRSAWRSASSARASSSSCQAAPSASTTRWCSGHPKSGITRRPASRSGTFTSGSASAASRIRPSTTSSSSLRVGAGPEATIRLSLARPERRPERPSAATSWAMLARPSACAWRTARRNGLSGRTGARSTSDRGGDVTGIIPCRVASCARRARAVHTYPMVGARCRADHSDLRMAVIPGEEAPQGSGGVVAQDRTGSTRFDGGQEVSLEWGSGVPHGVHAPVEQVQTGAPGSWGDGVVGQPAPATPRPTARPTAPRPSAQLEGPRRAGSIGCQITRL